MADLPGSARPIEAGEPLQGPARASVSLKEATPVPEESSPAEQVFETKASRIRLDDDEHEELARRLDTILQAIQDERDEQELDANWDLWEDLYFGVLQDRPAGQANVHVPIAQEVVDTALAVVEQGLFTARPWLQLQPREAKDVDGAKRKEAFLDYALSVRMQAKDRLDPMLWEAAALGTGVGYLPWLRETDRIRDEETYDGLSQADMDRFVTRYPDAESDFPEIVKKLRAGKEVTLTVEYDEARQDDPELTYVSIRDWIVRPGAKWHQLHRERFVGHRFPLRYANLEELTDDGYYDDRLQRLAFRWEEDGTFKDDPAFRDKRYDITTGILRWKRPNDTRERRYLVDYERESRTVLRVLHYPYWHNRINYIPWYFQRSRRSIYGISLIQKVEHSQFEVNAAHSLVLDAVAFGAIPMFKARKGTEGNFNPMRDGMYAGKTWYFDNPESDANAFQTGVTGAVNVLLNLEDRASRHAELASGSTQSASGLESSNDPNAPGNKTIALIQQAYVRIGKYLATLGWSLSELGFQVCDLYYQFSPKGLQYRVMGGEGMPVFERITRQELRLRADFFPHGSTSALNPDREKQEVFEFGGLLLKAPDLAQDPLKRWAVIEMMLDVAGDNWAKQKNKVLPSPEEMKVMEAVQQAKLQQAQMQLSGAAGAPTQPMTTPNAGMPPAPPSVPPNLAAVLGQNGNRMPVG